MSRLSLRNVTKRYGLVEAVKGISFEAKDSEFVAILGPSGCGKTSTMRMIAGLEPIDGGEIYFDDRLINKLEPARRNVAMAFENYGLYPHWDCFSNIAYPLRLRGLPSDEVSRRIHEVARILQIEDLLGVRPAEISGGARQRVGLARALVREPEVFLLDEPMSHVDPDLRSQMRVELKRLHRDLGATMVYVTHDQLEAMSMADRIVVMNHGTIQQVDTPHEIYNHPVNVFVGGFVGEPPVNFLPCKPGSSNGTHELVLESGETVPLPRRYEHAVELAPHRELILGVRPHLIDISHAELESGGIRARIYVVEPLGDSTIVTVKVGERILKVETGPGFSGAIDEAVCLSFDSDAILLFDAGTEQALT